MHIALGSQKKTSQGISCVAQMDSHQDVNFLKYLHQCLQCFIADIHYMAKSYGRSHVYVIVENPIPDLVPLCSYNNLHSSGRAF